MTPNSIRIDPFRDLLQLQGSLLRAFDTLDEPRTVHSHGEQAAVSGAWHPLVDVLEDQDRILIKVELSEVAEKDIDLRVEGNVLTLRGERKLEPGVERGSYRLLERTHGSFHRALALPDSVDGEQVTAEANNGVLYIRLPKRAESKSRQIKVQVDPGRPAKAALDAG
jgi:HSP20 family protein